MMMLGRTCKSGVSTSIACSKFQNYGMRHPPLALDYTAMDVTTAK
jgi:hypothetical protein